MDTFIQAILSGLGWLIICMTIICMLYALFAPIQARAIKEAGRLLYGDRRKQRRIDSYPICIRDGTKGSYADVLRINLAGDTSAIIYPVNHRLSLARVIWDAGADMQDGEFLTINLSGKR
jgi:hypothetical protein